MATPYLHMKTFEYAAYGGSSNQYGGCFDGQGDLSVAAESARVRIPVPVPIVVTSITISCKEVRTCTLVARVLKDGVDTDMVVTLGPSDEQLTFSSTSVSFSALDDICYKFTNDVGGLMAFPGVSVGMCLGYTQASGIQVFGVVPDAGSKNPDFGYIGGALGNGSWQTDRESLSVARSNTYSISALAGNITHLAMKDFRPDDPGTGTWTGRIKLNTIVQDGAGGTVDTTALMTGTDHTALATFSRSLVVEDDVDVTVYRGTTATPDFQPANVGVGIGFTPTTAGAFMNVGGSADSISATVTAWKWNRSKQTATPEGIHEAPIGPGGVRATALYVRRSGAPGVGSSYVHTLRQSGADTSLTVTVADAADDGLVTANVDYPAASYISLQSAPVGSPLARALHWGVALISDSVSTPPGSEVPGSGGGDEPPEPLAGSFTRTFECIHGSYSRTIPLSGSYLRTFSDSQGST
jgi:hypothetical protein